MTVDEIFPKARDQRYIRTSWIDANTECECVPVPHPPRQGTCPGGCCIHTCQATETYTNENEAVLTLCCRTNQMGRDGSREFCKCCHRIPFVPSTTTTPPPVRGEVTCYAEPCAPNACCHERPEYSLKNSPFNPDLWYECVCDHGFYGDGEKYDTHRPRVCTFGAGGCIGCIDINECSNGVAQCHPDAICINTPGNYDCVCKAGFTGDGLNCEPLGIPCGNPVVYCDRATEFCGVVRGICKAKKADGDCCYLDAAGNPRHQMCWSGNCRQSVNNFGTPIPNHFVC